MAFRAVVLALIAFVAPAQEPAPEPAKAKPVEFICPMDPDVRSATPGRCPRCKMKLEAGLPDFAEYPVRVSTSPRVVRPGAATDFTFEVLHPKTGKRVVEFEDVHERLFHLFYISEDLEYFAHEHPAIDSEGRFHFKATLPRPGQYRVLCDFYTKGGSPQMTARTIFAAGKSPAPRKPLVPTALPQEGGNIRVELTTEPSKPIAGQKTLLFFKISPAENLEPFLGAWGHMMAASEDLIDLVHQHPAFETGGPQIQFNLIFPREGMYKVWVQFQRQGVVNTVAFNVPVTILR